MFCFIGIKDNYNYLSLQKFKFNKADISQNNSFTKNASSPENEDFHVEKSLTLTCFEISK